jgi:MscS family membrane protein
MLLLLLASKKTVAALAAHNVAPVAPLQDLTDALLALGDDTGRFLRGLWPDPWSGWTFGRVSLSEVAEALLLFFVLLGLRWTVVAALRWLGRWLRARKVLELHHRVADLIFRTLNYLFLMASLFVSVSVLELPRHPLDWQLGAWRFWLSVLLCLVAFLTYRVAYVLLRNLFKGWATRELGLFDQGTVPLLRDLLRGAVFVVALITIVEVWGYNATTLLAGVGLGGLAIAFAAQDTIANIFGSLVIHLDQPFKVGDWIMMGDLVGAIEEIGIRSTRIRKPDKTPVTVPNKHFTTEIIANFNRMTARRVNTTLSLSIANPPAKLEEGLAAINRVLLAAMEPRTLPSGAQEPPRLQKEAWFARLSAITPTNYVVTVVALTVSTDYTYFQQLQEELLLEMLFALEEKGVLLAQTVLPPPDGSA